VQSHLTISKRYVFLFDLIDKYNNPVISINNHDTSEYKADIDDDRTLLSQSTSKDAGTLFKDAYYKLKKTKEKDIELQILNGTEEAAMTFLAARRWLGWSSGRLLILDIGGGSLEMAVGDDEYPEESISLPLGAARLTRTFLQSDPYTSKEVKKLEEFVKDALNSSLPPALEEHRADLFVATSKTFRTLARLNEFWFKDNPKKLSITSLEKAIPKLLAMNNKERAELPGVSSTRALQIVAGAIVAYSALSKLELDEVEICPWALREGIVLKWLDWMKI
jgi:exopolyphosphatase/guanosine-5'-triphosphate,3'-diphosphate pyrophosphatase